MSKNCSYLITPLLFLTFTLRRERLGQSDPENAYFLDSFGYVIQRLGLRWTVLAETELPKEARQGSETGSPVVAMVRAKREQFHCLPLGGTGQAVRKRALGRSCSQRGGCIDREIKGSSVLHSVSS